MHTFTVDYMVPRCFAAPRHLACSNRSVRIYRRVLGDLKAGILFYDVPEVSPTTPVSIGALFLFITIFCNGAYNKALQIFLAVDEKKKVTSIGLD